MSKTPELQIPRRRPVDPVAAAKFEGRAEDVGSSTAIERQAKLQEAPLPAAGATSTPPREPHSKSDVVVPGRRGTRTQPHTRSDGVPTRAVTLHLPVALARELRIEAARQGISVSRLVEQRLGQ